MVTSRKIAVMGDRKVVTVPVYQQLATICRELLSGNSVKPGDRFPSERELARAYRVSRVTANKVLSNLVAEGLLERRAGIGMFVTDNRSLHTSLREMESFTEHARALGMVPKTQVLDFRSLDQLEVPEAVRVGMQLASGEQVTYTERLRLADGEPVILEFRWLRAALVPGLQPSDLEGSCYALLEEKFDLALTGERYSIQARNLTEEQARKLGVQPRAAALMVEGPGYADHNRVVWYEDLLYRGDKYHLENVVRQHRRHQSTELRRK